MPRLRARQAGSVSLRLALSSVLLAALGNAAGCARHSETRIFLHGDVVDERGVPVPRAVVRLGSRETVTDMRGQYRFLYLTSCLRAGIGGAGYKNETLQAFSPGYEAAALEFELATAEIVGPAQCPADTDKFLRMTLLVPPLSGGDVPKAKGSK